MSKEISPMNQAFNEIPRAWYEIEPKKARLIFYMFPILVLTFANKELFHVDTLPAHIVSATLYAISTLADRYSTVKGLNANKLALESGIDTQTKETSPIVSNITDSKQFMRNRKALAYDIGMLALSLIFPAFGAGFTIGRIQSTASNLRITKRINRAIELVKIR